MRSRYFSKENRKVYDSVDQRLPSRRSAGCEKNHSHRSPGHYNIDRSIDNTGEGGCDIAKERAVVTKNRYRENKSCGGTSTIRNGVDIVGNGKMTEICGRSFCRTCKASEAASCAMHAFSNDERMYTPEFRSPEKHVQNAPQAKFDKFKDKLKDFLSWKSVQRLIFHGSRHLPILGPRDHTIRSEMAQWDRRDLKGKPSLGQLSGSERDHQRKEGSQSRNHSQVFSVETLIDGVPHETQCPLNTAINQTQKLTSGSCHRPRDGDHRGVSAYANSVQEGGLFRWTYPDAVDVVTQRDPCTGTSSRILIPSPSPKGLLENLDSCVSQNCCANAVNEFHNMTLKEESPSCYDRDEQCKCCPCGISCASEYHHSSLCPHRVNTPLDRLVGLTFHCLILSLFVMAVVVARWSAVVLRFALYLALHTAVYKGRIAPLREDTDEPVTQEQLKEATIFHSTGLKIILLQCRPQRCLESQASCRPGLDIVDMITETATTTATTATTTSAFTSPHGKKSATSTPTSTNDYNDLKRHLRVGGEGREGPRKSISTHSSSSQDLSHIFSISSA